MKKFVALLAVFFVIIMSSAVWASSPTNASQPFNLKKGDAIIIKGNYNPTIFTLKYENKDGVPTVLITLHIHKEDAPATLTLTVGPKTSRNNFNVYSVIVTKETGHTMSCKISPLWENQKALIINISRQ